MGNEIITAGTTASDTDTSEYQSEDIPYLINDDAQGQASNFVSKNETLLSDSKIANSTSLYKVPAKRIYYRKSPASVNQRLDLRIDNNNIYDNGNPITWDAVLGGNTSKPFTMVVSNGDLVIDGSFDAYNAMFIVPN